MLVSLGSSAHTYALTHARIEQVSACIRAHMQFANAYVLDSDSVFTHHTLVVFAIVGGNRCEG